jgi:hypothetical protein
MKTAAFALFCALALATAQALSQADVDNFLETAELANVASNRNLLQDAQGTPGSYGYGAPGGVAEKAAPAPVGSVGAAGTTCTQGKATLYTTSSTKMCVLSNPSDKTGSIYNGSGGRISTNTGTKCFVAACPAGTAAASTASSTTTSSTASHPFLGLSNLFGRRLASSSNRKLLAPNVFFPFFSVPFLSSGAGMPSTTASTTAVSTSYFSAQCYTLCE